MLESVPNFSELSVRDKDALIVRLFAVVEDLQDRLTLQLAENQTLRCKVKELRGKLAKNSQNSSKPPSVRWLDRRGTRSEYSAAGRESEKEKAGPPEANESQGLARSPSRFQGERAGICHASVDPLRQQSRGTRYSHVIPRNSGDRVIPGTACH